MQIGQIIKRLDIEEGYQHVYNDSEKAFNLIITSPVPWVFVVQTLGTFSNLCSEILQKSSSQFESTAWYLLLNQFSCLFRNIYNNMIFLETNSYLIIALLVHHNELKLKRHVSFQIEPELA